MFTSSNLLIKFVTAAALVSGAVAFTAYVLIGDGNISSDDINTIFDQALQENPELVTTLCEENLNESAAVQAFLQNNSDFQDKSAKSADLSACDRGFVK